MVWKELFGGQKSGGYKKTELILRYLDNGTIIHIIIAQFERKVKLFCLNSGVKARLKLTSIYSLFILF